MAVKLWDDDERITVTDAELPDVENGDPATVYTLVPLTTSLHQAVSQSVEEKRFNPRSHVKETHVDPLKLADALVDAVLVDWSGVVTKDGPAPCERAYKVRLDTRRKGALLQVAGINQIVTEDAQAQSFRPTAGTADVVAGS